MQTCVVVVDRLQFCSALEVCFDEANLAFRAKLSVACLEMPVVHSSYLIRIPLQ